MCEHTNLHDLTSQIWMCMDCKAHIPKTLNIQVHEDVESLPDGLV
jgi:ribosomal protein L37AE/L43A